MSQEILLMLMRSFKLMAPEVLEANLICLKSCFLNIGLLVSSVTTLGRAVLNLPICLSDEGSTISDLEVSVVVVLHISTHIACFHQYFELNHKVSCQCLMQQMYFLEKQRRIVYEKQFNNACNWYVISNMLFFHIVIPNFDLFQLGLLKI